LVKRLKHEGFWVRPAAVCRKVAMAKEGGEIEVWGDGKQTRSFLYIDFTGPVNIGSEEMVTIDQLVDSVAEIAGKRLKKRHIPGPTGVRGRNSDNRLIKERLQWAPSRTLREGLAVTYEWIERQVLLDRESNQAAD
jgi:nucleoside-diphosphate-sugar epimerase